MILVWVSKQWDIYNIKMIQSRKLDFGFDIDKKLPSFRYLDIKTRQKL